MPNTARVSHTSNTPHKDVGNYLGLYDFTSRERIAEELSSIGGPDYIPRSYSAYRVDSPSNS